MHPIMRLRFDCAVDSATMRESGANAAKARAAAARHALEVRLAERVHVDLAQRHENVAITVWAVALLDKKWIVAGAVRPVGGCKGWRQRVLLEVVPVRQRPVIGSAQTDHRIANNSLERDQVAAVPGQKIPAAVLTLVPVGSPVGLTWRRIGSAEIAVLLPQRREDPVDCGVESPAGPVVERTRLHRLDAACIPEDRIRPLRPQRPDVLACTCHVALPPFEEQHPAFAAKIYWREII